MIQGYTCKLCSAHNAHMQTVWRGLTKIYRERLANAKKAGDKAAAKRWVSLINKFVAKMRALVIYDDCPLQEGK